VRTEPAPERWRIATRKNRNDARGRAKLEGEQGQIQAKVGVAADGAFGPNTEAAVRRLQSSHGLVPDGIVGPATWAAIDSA
jgi:peptidoglycan hydrolase-like protein with peptidoglycan-binding domain